MTRLSFDPALRAVLAPTTVDCLEASFFHSTPKRTLPSPSEVRALRDGDSGGTVAFPDLALFVKFGHWHAVSLEEAQTLQAIHRAFPDGRVPVPELVAWRVEDDINYIYMSLVPGDTLKAFWTSLTLGERTNVANQLRQILTALESLRQEEGEEYIGAIDRGPVKTLYFEGEIHGPFPNVKAFNDAIQFGALPWQPLSDRAPDPVRHLLPDSASIRFSHADLHLGNIMIAGEPGSRTVVGIVDWGQAGWYPEFWEFCCMATETSNHEWYEHGWIDRVCKRYDEEFLAFETYWSWHGPP